jgi:hypothetical protein
VLKELPSANEAVKKNFLKKLKYKILIDIKIINANVIATPKSTSHFRETPAEIPIVIAQKYTVSSSGDRTGFLKRIIDRAPTIPSERAMFPEITLVIIYVMIGSITRVAV